MTQVAFGPVNITGGDSAFFTAEFFDSNGAITTPSTALLTIIYVNTSLASQTDTVALSPTGSFYTGTWSSALASFGLATWTITCTGSTTAQQTGVIRVIDP